MAAIIAAAVGRRCPPSAADAGLTTAAPHGAGGVTVTGEPRSVAVRSTWIVACSAPGSMSAASPLTLPAIRPIWPSRKTQ